MELSTQKKPSKLATNLSLKGGFDKKTFASILLKATKGSCVQRKKLASR